MHHQGPQNNLQAQKFHEVDSPLAKDCIDQIKSAKSPEEAARIGRMMQRQCPDLVRSDWDAVKINVMYKALRCKFTTYPHLHKILLSTKGSVLVEASPHDLFWGGGRDGEGLNYLVWHALSTVVKDNLSIYRGGLGLTPNDRSGRNV
ncbi:hypothetical protein QJS10_CPB04g01376 [Acorus calamus]|uniref:NADAR domain-containing protein n=1 Tax=Acorus calamus TaxID=4465 RepID=A0AAV9EZR6_ACOCL|nr:hypothetical protein QJS10_CPB04g01376 [Acorus calamus]